MQHNLAMSIFIGLLWLIGATPSDAQCTVCAAKNHNIPIEPGIDPGTVGAGNCPWNLVELQNAPPVLDPPATSSGTGGGNSGESFANHESATTEASVVSGTVSSSDSYSRSKNYRFTDGVSACSCNAWSLRIVVQFTASGEYVANGPSSGAGTASISGGVAVQNSGNPGGGVSGGASDVGFSGGASLSSATTTGGSFSAGLQIGPIGGSVGGGGFPITSGGAPVNQAFTQQTVRSGPGGEVKAFVSLNSSSGSVVSGSGNPQSPATLEAAVENFVVQLNFTGECNLCETVVTATQTAN